MEAKISRQDDGIPWINPSIWGIFGMIIPNPSESGPPGMFVASAPPRSTEHYRTTCSFPEIGVPLNRPFLFRIFHYKPSSYWGPPWLWKPPCFPLFSLVRPKLSPKSQSTNPPSLETGRPAGNLLTSGAHSTPRQWSGFHERESGGSDPPVKWRWFCWSVRFTVIHGKVFMNGF